ncbi:MAG: hypothetical protein U9P61_01970 [Patescibacteria group bacterium]|nr:hypothetical protein [Patescibacteria group bacterium]
MNIVDFIKSGRKRGLSDDFILEEIKKQAPHKREAFNVAINNGATTLDIVEEILRQNKERKQKKEEQRKVNEKVKDHSVDDSIFNDKKEKNKRKDDRLWLRVFITLIFICITSLSLAFFYRSLFVPKIESISPIKIIEEVSVPHAHYPFIKMDPEKDDIRRFSISTNEEYLINIRNIMREVHQSKVVRIIAENHITKETSIFDLVDFFEVFKINYPESFFDDVEKEFDLIVYPEIKENNLGLIFKFKKGKEDNLRWMIMRPWEETIEKDFSYFFGYFGEKLPETKNDFLSIEYDSEYGTEISTIRYCEGEKNMGLYYSITETHFIFGTSLKTIQTIIDRHYQL